MLEVKNIVKNFQGVHALKSVSATFYDHEIHGLVGENGAGKSTLMKIISGVYPPDRGEIYLYGERTHFRNPMEAYNAGVRIVHQELSLIQSLSIAENMYIHKFRQGSVTTFLDRKKFREDASKTLEEWGIEVDAGIKVSEVSMGVRQLVEIARELSTGGKVIILDEPTSSLTFKEIDNLFNVLKMLKSQGYIVIFISHRLNEVTAIVDRVTILRDGEMIETAAEKNITPNDMVNLIAGRDLTGGDIGELFPKTEAKIGEVALKVENLSGYGFENVNFEAHWGEIFGIAGLVGAGRSELIRTIYGLQQKKSGHIYIEGKTENIQSPEEAKEKHLGFLSENRGGEGVFPALTVALNLIILKTKTIVKNLFLNKNLIKEKSNRLVNDLTIVTHDAIIQKLSELSGGNQQKVVFGRLLGSEPKILLLDEPTRGVDVGNKTEIHKIIGQFVKNGGCVIMVSSESDELIGVSDRVMVLHEGKQVGLFNRNEFNKEELLRCMMQVQKTA